MRSLFIAASFAAACTLLSSCSKPAKATMPDPMKPVGPPHLETTIPLPNNAGTVHVIAVPSEFYEITRCLVVTTPAGAVSTTCANRQLDASALADK